MGWLAMNCATVLCIHLIYTSNSLSPASLGTSAIGGYSQPSYGCCFRRFPVIVLTTLWWNLPMVNSIWWVTTQISDLNSSVACTSAT